MKYLSPDQSLTSSRVFNKGDIGKLAGLGYKSLRQLMEGYNSG